MRRGILLFTSLCLLGTLAGCRHGVCDCSVVPLGQGTPGPAIHPVQSGPPPIAGGQGAYGPLSPIPAGGHVN
jgi:hypothetical protein